MKITQTASIFQPINILIETNEDLYYFIRSFELARTLVVVNNDLSDFIDTVLSDL